MLDVNSLLGVGGVLGVLIVGLIIFSETGLLIGFFLPGDTLLIAAGLFASDGKLPILLLLPVLAVASIIGYEVGYRIGRNAGPRFFKRKGGILFREDYIKRTENFFIRHGGKTILLARFIAVVRTIVPLVAGMGQMNRASFHFYNIAGGILWTFSITLGAYWIGSQIPNLDHYIVYLVVFAMVVTSGSVLVELLRSSKRRRALATALREELGYFFGRRQDS